MARTTQYATLAAGAAPSAAQAEALAGELGLLAAAIRFMDSASAAAGEAPPAVAMLEVRALCVRGCGWVWVSSEDGSDRPVLCQEGRALTSP